jgi:hypothetical protein
MAFRDGDRHAFDGFIPFMNQGIAPLTHFLGVQDLQPWNPTFVSYAVNQQFRRRIRIPNARSPIRPQARFELCKQSHNISAFELARCIHQVSMANGLQYRGIMLNQSK